MGFSHLEFEFDCVDEFIILEFAPKKHVLSQKDRGVGRGGEGGGDICSSIHPPPPYTIYSKMQDMDGWMDGWWLSRPPPPTTPLFHIYWEATERERESNKSPFAQPI